MKLVWFKELSPTQKDNLEAILKNNTLLFTQLAKILKDRYDSIERRSLDEETYRTPDWASLEAFRNGRRAELEFFADLINFSSDIEKKDKT